MLSDLATFLPLEVVEMIKTYALYPTPSSALIKEHFSGLAEDIEFEVREPFDLFSLRNKLALAVARMYFANWRRNNKPCGVCHRLLAAGAPYEEEVLACRHMEQGIPCPSWCDRLGIVCHKYECLEYMDYEPLKCASCGYVAPDSYDDHVYDYGKWYCYGCRDKMIDIEDDFDKLIEKLKENGHESLAKKVRKLKRYI